MEAIDAENKHVVTLLWKVKNADLMDTNFERLQVSTPCFPIAALMGRRFQLVLSVKHIRTQKYLSLNLVLDDKSFDFPIDMEWSFLGSDGKPISTEKELNHYPIPNYKCPKSDFLTFEDLFHTRRSEFFNHKALTIRLRIWKSHGDLANGEFISCQTRLETLIHNFHWKIYDISRVRLNQELTFPVILYIKKKRAAFRFEFFFQGVSLFEANAMVQFCFPPFPEEWNSTMSVLIQDNEMNYRVSTDRSGIYKESYENLRLMNLTSRRHLFTEGLQCLTNDVLTLLCEVSLLHSTSSIEKSCFNLPNSRDLDLNFFLNSCSQTSEPNDDPTAIGVQQKDSSIPSGKSYSTFTDAISHTSEEDFDVTPITFNGYESLRILAKDILSLYRNETLTDFELHSGNDSFHAHKNILSARSEFFKEMFTSKSQDSGPNVTDIPELDTQTLNETLTFLYSGQMENLNLKSILKLHDAAEKYKIQSLNDVCCNIIRSHINTKNFYDVLRQLDRHKDLFLQILVHDFVFLNFDEIFKSPAWKAFEATDHELSSKIMEEIYKRKPGCVLGNSQ